MLERATNKAGMQMRELLERTFFHSHVKQLREFGQPEIATGALELFHRSGPERLEIIRRVSHNDKAEQREVMKAAHKSALALSTMNLMLERLTKEGLPLVTMLQAEPLLVQSSHLSFQEYFTACAIAKASTSRFELRIPTAVGKPWEWNQWWLNTLKLGLELGPDCAYDKAQAFGV